MNPLLPLNVYIPDGEPHVFGDRVYLYGSHDKEGGDRFCMLDYEVWSAPISDLSDWSCKGTSYKKVQDPHSINGKPVDFYAPDCVKGNDGKYYLYYVAMGPNTKNFGPMSVAVSDLPDGPFEYLGDVKYKDGTPVLNYLTNDPAVINDDGRIYLYYGWGLSRDFRSKLFSPVLNFVQSKLFKRSVKEIKNTKPSILSCAVVELEEDMMTVKYEPKAVLDSKTTADKKSELYTHAFYEAPSIRKFGDTYYLIYSSGYNNELAYATSKYPDKDFVYRGVLISNSDLGYKGNTQRLAPAGTIHGSIEKINGEYYVFYHRCTHNTDYSRQACAERIKIEDDGLFKQVQVTSCGLDKFLVANGEYPAAIACVITNGKTRQITNRIGKYNMPNITHKGDQRFITDIGNKTLIGFRFFLFNGCIKVNFWLKGNGKGKMYVSTSERDKSVCAVDIHPSEEWNCYETEITASAIQPLFFYFEGKGSIEFYKFKLT